jgi:hypothetical protein
MLEVIVAEKPGGKGNGMHPLWQFPQIESSDRVRIVHFIKVDLVRFIESIIKIEGGKGATE